MLALGVATFVILAPIASWMREAAPRDGGDRGPVIDDLAAVPEDARAAPEWRACLQRPRETRWRRCRPPRLKPVAREHLRPGCANDFAAAGYDPD